MKEFKEREGKGWRIEELRKSEAKKNSGSRSRRAEMGGGGGGGISPRLWSVPFFILRAQASAVFMAVI